MAFPSVRSSATTNGTVANSTATINLPGTIRAGDTLLIQFRCAVAGAVTPPSGWDATNFAELVDASPDAADDQIWIAWYKANGTEGSTVTLGANGNGKFCAIAWAIRDAADPLIRPPELSTVATGSGTEPNATTVTPTGGSKDYLWLTVYSMEGEQTGVTSYPSGYTLSQQFANSGTASTVGTNCTMAGAARQNTAASEDAGVWDVTGTLDDWSAYTLAFHPAEAVTAGLENARREMPSYVPPRRSVGGAALTIAATLLFSTLAPPPVPVPFAQLDWPLPALHARFLMVSSSTVPDDSTSSDDPFRQRDWPNPPPKRVLAQTWAINLLQATLRPAAAPFAQIHWPNPRSAARPIVDWTQARPQFAVDASAFSQADWPVPLPRRAPALTWLQTRPIGAVDEPTAFIQAWPNPQPIRSAAHTWLVGLLNSTLQVAEPVPPAAGDWPVPLRQGHAAITWTDNRLASTLALVEPVPFVQTEWPNPQPRHPTVVVSIESRLDESTSSDRPFVSVDWLTPRERRRLDVTAGANLLASTLSVAPVPFLQTDWSNPPRARDLALTWIQTRPIFAVDETPAHQTDWPLPGRASIAALTWIQTRPIFAADDVPGHQTEWPVPRRATVPALSWLQPRPILVVDQPTAFVPAWPNPGPRRAPALTWTWSTLSSTLAPMLPLRQMEYPTPPRPTVAALTWVQSRPPFAQDEPTRFAAAWPNPRLRPAPAQTWVVEHLLRTTIASLTPPPSSGEWPLPLRSLVPALTWIQTRPIGAVDEPTAFTPDLALPVRARAATLTWSVNLLEATLSAAPTPITPTIFENPKLRVQAAAVWLQSRPPYYVDSPTAFVPEWPVPHGRRRARVFDAPTLLTTTLSAAEPFRPMAWMTPARLRSVALTWAPSAPVLTALVATPIGVTETALPRRAPTTTTSWTQARPVYYIEPATSFVPEWPLPAPARRLAITWTISLLQTGLAPTGAAVTEICLTNEFEHGLEVSGEIASGSEAAIWEAPPLHVSGELAHGPIAGAESTAGPLALVEQDQTLTVSGESDTGITVTNETSCTC
jgi:hypothetical protein